LVYPEIESTECAYCRKYQHYSSSNPEPDKRGKPILANGKPILRPLRQVVNCDGCWKKAFGWTDENRKIYTLWRMYKFGVVDVDSKLAWSFFRLEEAERDIERRRNGSH